MSDDVGLDEIVFVTFGMQWRWMELRPYLVSVAASVSLHNMWRVPAGAYEWGALSHAAGVTAAALALGLPAALLQLAMGQLSQQDPVGVWKAVPFFKGVGYLRLLISFICSIYNSIYLALSAAFFLYTLGRSIPFEECYLYDRVSLNTTNATECLSSTFLAPVAEKPEYYIALILIIIVTWSTIPFLLYSPVKYLKRVLFVAAPLGVVLAALVQAGAGDSGNLALLRWGPARNFLSPQFWHSAVTQAFLSTHTAGGFLIAASDPIYSNVDLKRTAIFLVVTNIVGCWLSLLFWYSIGSQPPFSTPVAVLTQIYDAAVDRNLHATWPLMMFAMLVCMGIVTILCLVFPVYERCRRGGGVRWRQVCAVLSVAGAGAALALLYAGLPALRLLQHDVAPFLITLTTAAEILIFFFVYGRKYIVEDIEFLTGRRFNAWWSYSFCVVPAVVLPLWLWWVIAVSLRADAWLSQTYVRLTLTICFLLVLAVIVAFALVAIAKQDQYDKRSTDSPHARRPLSRFISRLKSSMRPSKDWGPSDPVSHHYWLEKKKENEKRARRGRGSDASHIYDDVVESVRGSPPSVRRPGRKARSNSYDWVYTGHRRVSGERGRRDMRRDVRRSQSCDLAARAPERTQRCATIARLSNSLQKMHSIPPARPSVRRKSAV